MSFDLGKTVGAYEFLDVLSSTKSEIRYRVRNVLAQRLEVLRVLPRGLQDDQERVERFLREMKVHARLAHPNIVGFYAAMELERQLVMTTEMVEGPTLADRLQAGPLPWQEALNYAGQVLAALSYAHAQGVVHRDISPERMILTGSGVLKLADFGLAKASTSPHLTQAGIVLGTLKYISPEQVKGSPILDPRSDLYSLGAVLFEALAGKPLFESKSQFDLMLAHVTEVPRKPSEVNPQLPPMLDAIVLKAIAKDPGQRFQTADEFRAALDRAKNGVEKPPADTRLAPAVAAGTSMPVPALPQVAGAASPALFAQSSAESWDSRQLTMVGIMSAAMALFGLIAYALAGH